MAWFSIQREWHSKRVIKQCTVSLREMEQASLHIESGIDPLDSRLLCQPIVSVLNAICGHDGDDRFKPVKIEELLDALARLQKIGKLNEVLSLTPYPVASEILRACGILFAQTTDLLTRGSKT